jgi:hypothetical protein
MQQYLDTAAAVVQQVLVAPLAMPAATAHLVEVAVAAAVQVKQVPAVEEELVETVSHE